MKSLIVKNDNTSITPWQGSYYSGEPRSSSKGEVFSYFLRAIRKRKISFLLPLFIIVPLVMLGISQEVPLYKATSTIAIENTTPQLIPAQEMITPDLSQIDYATEFEILKSRFILEKVVDELNLDRYIEEPENLKGTYLEIIKFYIKYYKDFAIEHVKNIFGNQRIEENLSQDDLRREAAIQMLAGSVRILPKPMTKLVDINMIGIDAQYITRIVNTLSELYVQYNLDKKLQTTRKAIEWLRSESDKLRDKMQASEMELQGFRERRAIISFDFSEDHNIPLKNLSELNSLYISTKRERINLESDINEIKAVLSKDLSKIESYPDIINTNIIISYKNKFSAFNTEIQRLKNIYTENHPKMIQLKSEIDQVEKDIRHEIHGILNGLTIKYRATLSKEKAFEKEISQQKQDLINTDNDLIEYAALKREAEINRELYLSVSKKLRETSLTEALEINNTRIIQHASIPLYPEPSGKLLKLFSAVIVGLLIGFGYVIFSEYMDKRFRDAYEVEDKLNIPFLGEIPHIDQDMGHQDYMPVALKEPMSVAAEAYRILRTRIYATPGRELSTKTLLITSAVSGEGKSTTSANLGISFAHLGLRVLLVDIDLRRPSLHRHFHVTEGKGMTEILQYHVSWQEVQQSTSMENLKLITSGTKPHNPSELLSSTEMQRFMAEVRESFDIVIFDAPVVLSIPDVEIISSSMDKVVLVHNPEYHNSDLVIEAKKILERSNVNIVGIVFNNVPLNDGYSHYYNSGYYINASNGKQDIIDANIVRRI